MSQSFKPGLLPSEVAFLCEMELVTVIPREKLAGLELLGGSLPPLRPPFPTPLPLWYALLLRRQNRCNIRPPTWLSISSLTSILDFELDHAGEAFSPGPRLGPPTTSPPPIAASSLASSQAIGLDGAGYLDGKSYEPSTPFLGHSAADARGDALPYHWLEMAHLLLAHCAGDFEDADGIRRLIRDLREVRMAKLRRGVGVLDGGGGVQMNGVGGMEVCEVRGLVGGVVDGLRKIGMSREIARREGEEEGEDVGRDDEDDDDI
ncbi:DNA replication complex GINS protein psf2 [Sphaceloma murrayae]|uniref:DNA replication complex GINS protein PSF2 n=1 Tax=Sphaceloma murrayae TaxID=2082308 RepID=A0A2K1QFU7_9PEZI|nr:DNA replication complex GINS protein psf2 [Sphaceloma murrayae]